MAVSITQAQTDHWEAVAQDGTTWRYLVPAFEPIQYWKEPSFNDDTWAEGPSGFGYGDGDDAKDIAEMQMQSSVSRCGWGWLTLVHASTAAERKTRLMVPE